MRRKSASWAICRQIIAALALVTFSGCSLFAPSKQTIHVTSSPEGAKVLAGGQPVGQTPVQFEAHRGDNLLIEVQKTGYQRWLRLVGQFLPVHKWCLADC